MGKKTLAESVADLERFILFLDNLISQETDTFKSTVAELKGVCWFGLKNATDIWQVIDAGLAQMLKVLVGQKHRMWLDESDNANRWYENQTPYTAMERRILIMHWSCLGNLMRAKLRTFAQALLGEDGLSHHR